MTATVHRVAWTRLPDGPPARLGPRGPARCTVRAEPGDRPGTAERCAGLLGHAPLMAGGPILWAGTAVEGHEPWVEGPALPTAADYRALWAATRPADPSWTLDGPDGS